METLLGVIKEDVLKSIPYWLVLARLTKKQLLSLAKDKNTELPDKCIRTREAIYKVVLSSYDEWHDTLDKASSLYHLLEAFPDPDVSMILKKERLIFEKA